MADLEKTVRGPVKPIRTPAVDKFLNSLSVKPQDLSTDALLASSPRANVAALDVPAVGGIPIFARIGRGGMGAVYYGIHPRLKKEVAIKILTIDAQDSPDSVNRFFREAQIAANLQSPNLVSVLDVNEENNLFFIVMEYVSGITAGAFTKEVIQGGEVGLDEISALDICIAATEGLAVAHDAGIIHRDIKPENIMVPYDKNGLLASSKAKLADLGLARSQGGNTNQSLSSESVCGTLGYMSPEQTRSSKLTKKPSDVFSMGATLYAMLTGHPPFTGSSPVEIILATVQSFPKPITKYRSDISGETLALIERCLSKNDNDRPADATELLLALKECRAIIAKPTRNSAVVKRTVIAAKIMPKPDLDQDTILNTFKYTTPPAVRKGRANVGKATAGQPTIRTAPARDNAAKKPNASNMVGLVTLGALTLIVLGVAGYLVFKEKAKDGPSVFAKKSLPEGPTLVNTQPAERTSAQPTTITTPPTSPATKTTPPKPVPEKTNIGESAPLGVNVIQDKPLVLSPDGKTATLFLNNEVRMEFVRIPAGTFKMGSDDTDAFKNQKPAHTVRITKDFFMAKYETTQEQWNAVMGAEHNPSISKGAKLPVESVSWELTQDFLKKISAKYGIALRLPTEAEWEYACRAGSTTNFHSGNTEDDLAKVGWYNINSPTKFSAPSASLTHDVGGKAPNAWGLYDMHGNVSEWCSDWSGGKYRSEEQIDPQGPEEKAADRFKSRVHRGGSYGEWAEKCRSTWRNALPSGEKSKSIGIRAVLTK